MKNSVTPSQVRHSLPGSTAEPVAPRTWNIAVLPGDGIGSEVMAEGLKVLNAVAARLQGVAFVLSEHPVGATEFLRHGNPLPESSFAACEQADAILLGAMGLPSVRWPDGKEMTPQIDLRERLDHAVLLRRRRPQCARDRALGTNEIRPAARTRNRELK